MSQFDLDIAFSRRRLWKGMVAASAALAGLCATTLPAHAQINGWMSQMNPWGPTYNQHTAPNIMTPRMNYTPPVTIPQTQQQFRPQFGFPQMGSQGGFSPQYPQMPSQYYPSYPAYPQNFGQGYGNQYQAQGPTFIPSSPQRFQHHDPAGPPKATPPTGNTGPGGVKVTITQSARGGSVTLPGSSIPIRGFGVDTPSGYQNNFPYAPLPTNNGPAYVGGYYYGNYTDTYCAGGYPSVYSVYGGLPQYIYNVGTGLTVVGDPYYPVYATSYLPFNAPTEQVTYNQNNYQTNNQYNYYTNGAAADQQTTSRTTVPSDSYQAAFGDIEQAWKTGDLSLIQKHIRDSDTRLSVYFKGKYSYSVASGDFVQITRDALDRLHTVSFQFTRLRKAKNGDVTAYGKQVYRATGGGDALGDVAAKDDTVPFRTDGTQPTDDGQPYDRAGDPANGAEKTVYVSYLLRRYGDQWNIIGIDTSPTNLVK